MTVGDVTAARIARRGAAEEEDLCVERASAEEQLPVRRARRHIEGRRHKDRLRAAQRHDLRELGETDVEADLHAKAPKRRIKHREISPRGERVALAKPLPARNVDVEEMHLAMARDLPPRRIENEAGIVEAPLRRLGE